MRHPVRASNDKKIIGTYEAKTLLLQILYNNGIVNDEPVTAVEYLADLAKSIDDEQHHSTTPRNECYDHAVILKELQEQASASGTPTPGLAQMIKNENECPISHTAFCYPVIASDSITYEAMELLKWFRTQRENQRQILSPVAKEPIVSIIFNRAAWSTLNKLPSYINNFERYPIETYPRGPEPVMRKLQKHLKLSVKQNAVVPKAAVSMACYEENIDDEVDAPIDDVMPAPDMRVRNFIRMFTVITGGFFLMLCIATLEEMERIGNGRLQYMVNASTYDDVLDVDEFSKMYAANTGLFAIPLIMGLIFIGAEIYNYRTHEYVFFRRGNQNNNANAPVIAQPPTP